METQFSFFHLKSVEAQASGVNGSATPESDDVS